MNALRAFATGARVLLRGVGLLLTADRPLAAAFVGLVMVLGVLPVGQVWLSKVVVDRLASGGASGAMTPALLYATALVAAAGLTPVMNALADRLRDRAFGDVDRRLMRAGTKLVDLYRVERPAFQDELKMASAVVWQWPILLWLIQTGVGTTLTLAGVLILLARLHPLLPLALVALTVPSMVVAERAHRLRVLAMGRQSRAGREMDYCVRLATEPSAAKEVRIFGLGGYLLQRFRERSQAALREMNAIRRYELRLSGGLVGLQALGVAAGFWYVGAQVGAGQLSIGEVALYVTAVVQAESRLSMFSRLFWQMKQALLHLPVLFAFLESAGPSISVAPRGVGRPVPSTLRSGVELRRVGFRYPDGPAAVLDGLDAVLPAGKVTALVGANGAGKSTLVKLLTRMYDPTEGEILLDGAPLAAYDLESLRSGIAVAYQDFARFSLTLRENIAVGAAALAPVNGHAAGRIGGDANSHAGDIEVAAQFAGADEVAAKLPLGYDTRLTRRFAGGVDLSGGEWQKVALARAFIRDAALVVLDEPTAALDAEAEYRLFNRFRELVAGKTALLISHRFSTVRMADHIVVLEGGRAVEAGSHDALLSLGERYAALYEMQAGRYR